MIRITNSKSEIFIREVCENDAIFLQYLFTFRDIAEKCMIPDLWINNVKEFITSTKNKNTDWIWIIEDSTNQPIGVLMNYIRPVLNGLPALWSSYGILPRERGKNYATLALCAVDEIIKKNRINVMWQALLINCNNSVSEKVALKCGFEKTFSGGRMPNGKITEDVVWLKEMN